MIYCTHKACLVPVGRQPQGQTAGSSCPVHLSLPPWVLPLAPFHPQAEAKARDAALSNCSFLAADVEAVEWRVASFDAILCSNALPFLQDIPAALHTWHGWLRDGGRVVFNTPMASAATHWPPWCCLWEGAACSVVRWPCPMRARPIWWAIGACATLLH